MDDKKLIELAIKARDTMTYTPYSHYNVGAAVEMEDGTVYCGGNIENASLTPTNCAERTAIFKAVSEGKREIKKIAVVGDSHYTYPCGVCRQVIKEFSKNPRIIVANSLTDYRVHTIDEILPFAFGPEDLEDKWKNLNQVMFLLLVGLM